MAVYVKIIKDLKSCGAIYYTDETKNIFEDILGKENVEISWKYT